MVMTTEISKRTTGKFDSKGAEIFENDKVIHAWMWGSYLGAAITVYQIHTITVRDAYLMGNGEMHDDGGGIIFCLGNAYNFWEGDSVTKLSQEELDKINVPDDTRFFFNSDGKAVIYTDQHFWNATDDEWINHKFNLKKMFEDFLMSKIN
jgi:hypothetical protein